MDKLIDNLKYLRSIKGVTQHELAETIGIKRGMIASYETGTMPPLDILQKIVDYFDTTIDSLLNSNLQNEPKEPSKRVDIVQASPGIPLMTNARAIGGISNSHFAVEQKDVKEYYIIPKFNHQTVDFMIEVEGTSMHPKYNNGDIVACRIIKEHGFIQWNKAYLVATRDQGILIKRIREGSNDKVLQMVSENRDYPPFEVPKKEITGIALVIGVIRLE